MKLKIERGVVEVRPQFARTSAGWLISLKMWLIWACSNLRRKHLQLWTIEKRRWWEERLVSLSKSTANLESVLMMMLEILSSIASLRPHWMLHSFALRIKPEPKKLEKPEIQLPLWSLMRPPAPSKFYFADPSQFSLKKGLGGGDQQRRVVWFKLVVGLSDKMKEYSVDSGRDQLIMYWGFKLFLLKMKSFLASQIFLKRNWKK